MIRPVIDQQGAQVFQDDCRKVMPEFPDNSIDAVITDPPYEIRFMGREWDSTGIAYDAEVWTQAIRILKPGGHVLAFGGTRTWHRLAVAIEDAGFEIRDSIAWLYGSGFPKSLDVSKAIDKAAGFMNPEGTDAARQWQGWGTALKPAFEPIVVARKPLIGTVAENVQQHGTGALNIDGCRIAADDGRPLILSKSEASTGILGDGLNGSSNGGTTTQGRWPANVILDEAQAAELDQQSGERKAGNHPAKRTNIGYHGGGTGTQGTRINTGTGGASRFFYTAKANASERPRANGIAHPTVKPLSLMHYLIRLITTPNATILDPFAGSGTTLQAAIQENRQAIGIEITPEYIPLIQQRLQTPTTQTMF